MVEVHSVCSLLQYSVVLHASGMLFINSPAFLTLPKLPWVRCSVRGLSVCHSPWFGWRRWKGLIVQGSRSVIETNLGNELRHPCWIHPDSSGTVGTQHQGNCCTYCMQRGDGFAGLYLFDFPLKIFKVWAKNVTLWVTEYLSWLRFQEERIFYCCFQ